MSMLAGAIRGNRRQISLCTSQSYSTASGHRLSCDLRTGINLSTQTTRVSCVRTPPPNAVGRGCQSASVSESGQTDARKPLPLRALGGGVLSRLAICNRTVKRWFYATIAHDGFKSSFAGREGSQSDATCGMASPPLSTAIQGSIPAAKKGNTIVIRHCGYDDDLL
jgi:hypothetical protein